MDGSRSSWLGSRFLLTVLVGGVVVGLGVLPGWSRSDPPSSEVSDQARMVSIQQNLTNLQERLTALARQVIKEQEDSLEAGRQLGQAMREVQEAESKYQSARLDREVAKLLFREYTEVGFAQEQAEIERAIQRARKAVELDQARLDDLKARQAILPKAVNEETASGILVIVDLKDRVNRATYTLEIDQAVLEQAESKKDVLSKFTKAKRTLELDSNVKKAHAEELASQATLGLQKAKVEALKREAKATWPRSATGKRLLALIDEAIPVQDKVHAQFEEYRKSEKSDASRLKEIEGLTNHLESMIVEGEALRAANAFNEVRSRLEQATR